MGEVILGIAMLVPGILLLAAIGVGILWCVELRSKPRRVSERAVAAASIIEVGAIHVVNGFTARGGFHDVLLLAPVSVPVVLAICVVLNMIFKLIYDRWNRERAA